MKNYLIIITSFLISLLSQTMLFAKSQKGLCDVSPTNPCCQLFSRSDIYLKKYYLNIRNKKKLNLTNLSDRTTLSEFHSIMTFVKRSSVAERVEEKDLNASMAQCFNQQGHNEDIFPNQHAVLPNFERVTKEWLKIYTGLNNTNISISFFPKYFEKIRRYLTLYNMTHSMKKTKFFTADEKKLLKNLKSKMAQVVCSKYNKINKSPNSFFTKSPTTQFMLFIHCEVASGRFVEKF